MALVISDVLRNINTFFVHIMKYDELKKNWNVVKLITCFIKDTCPGKWITELFQMGVGVFDES